MRITENQIRRIIRQTLKKAILTEGKRASNWEEYVEYTVTNNPTLNITEEDVQGMVDDYKNIVSHFNRRLSDPEDDEGLTKETMGNLSWEEGQTDSYKDFVSWYMRFNASSNRNEFYDDGKDDKWIDPAGLVDIFYILSASLAKQNEEAPKEPEENKRWLGRKLAAASDRRKRRRAARKEGREERKDIKNYKCSDTSCSTVSVDSFSNFLRFSHNEIPPAAIAVRRMTPAICNSTE